MSSLLALAGLLLVVGFLAEIASIMDDDTRDGWSGCAVVSFCLAVALALVSVLVLAFR